MHTDQAATTGRWTRRDDDRRAAVLLRCQCDGEALDCGAGARIGLVAELTTATPERDATTTPRAITIGTHANPGPSIEESDAERRVSRTVVVARATRG